MRAVIPLAILAAFITIFAISRGTVSARDNPVAVGNLFFCSASLSGQVCETQVEVGDTVTWSNQSGIHTVTQCTDSTFTSCGSGFDSGTLNQGEAFSHSFPVAGTSYYRCEFHPTEMRGRIVALQPVTPGPSPAATGGTASPTTAPSLPNTGGLRGHGGTAALHYALLAAGMLLVAAAGGGLALARRKG
jgi:hypothetical protein